MVSLTSRELKRGKGALLFLGLGWWGVDCNGVTTFRNFSKKRLSLPLVEDSVDLPICISAGMGFLLFLPEKIWNYILIAKIKKIVFFFSKVAFSKSATFCKMDHAIIPYAIRQNRCKEIEKYVIPQRRTAKYRQLLVILNMTRSSQSRNKN